MKELYSVKDYQQIGEQLKKRYLALGIVSALLLAVIVWSLIARIEWLTMVAVFLFGAAIVFCVDLLCMPLYRYRKLVAAALTGRTHTDTLEYKEQESGISLVEGVKCLGLLFLGEPDKHGTREQRYYWDAEIPLPPFRAGDQVTLKYTGKNIIGYQLNG